MLAVIKTGGKQYIVTPGTKIKIEKLEGDESKDSSSPSLLRNKSSVKKEGAEVIFDQVLLLVKNKPSTRAKLGAGPVPHRNEVSGAGKVEIGTPLVKGVKVTGKVLKQGKAKKVIIFKYKPKKRYKKKTGHRQPFTEVEITGIKAE